MYFHSWQNDPLCDGPFPKTFDEVKRTLENCRKQKYGKAPTNCEEILREFQRQEIFTSLGHSLHKDRGVLFNTVQKGSTFENCIFSSAKSIALIKDNVDTKDRFFAMDATFRVTPRGKFKQLLIIHARFGKKFFPIVYALMSRKTTEAYFNILKYVHEKLIPIRGAGIIIDFEKAERLAIERLKTGIKIFGCWFHFCQSLRRKLATMGELFEVVRNEEKVKTIFSQFQCLALLPAAEIEKCFRELAKKALKETTLFAEFIDYFDREWIKIVKPKHFSIFMLGTRTTGSAETFNGQINQRFKTHGNFFHFCEALQKEELVIATQLENFVTGSIQQQKQPKFYKKRNELIRKFSLMLQNGEIAPSLFLITMANRKNKVVFADEEISLNEIVVETQAYGGDEDDEDFAQLVADWSDSDMENDLDEEDARVQQFANTVSSSTSSSSLASSSTARGDFLFSSTLNLS